MFVKFVAALDVTIRKSLVEASASTSLFACQSVNNIEQIYEQH
jgi:hypothetical protein